MPGFNLRKAELKPIAKLLRMHVEGAPPYFTPEEQKYLELLKIRLGDSKYYKRMGHPERDRKRTSRKSDETEQDLV